MIFPAKADEFDPFTRLKLALYFVLQADRGSACSGQQRHQLRAHDTRVILEEQFAGEMSQNRSRKFAPREQLVGTIVEFRNGRQWSIE
jgi:hypothetical protein